MASSQTIWWSYCARPFNPLFHAFTQCRSRNVSGNWVVPCQKQKGNMLIPLSQHPFHMMKMGRLVAGQEVSNQGRMQGTEIGWNFEISCLLFFFLLIVLDSVIRHINKDTWPLLAQQKRQSVVFVHKISLHRWRWRVVFSSSLSNFIYKKFVFLFMRRLWFKVILSLNLCVINLDIEKEIRWIHILVK